MIFFKNVSKSYRLKGSTKVVIDRLTLRLKKGESLGLLGRNGAGKSTLLKMIGGTLSPDSGEIQRSGSISWPLGFSGGFHMALTGVQNARFIARIYGVDTDDLVDFVEDFSELGKFLQMPVGSYSSGMRARLAFGVSMGINFDCYLVDEITAVGDAIFKRKCQQVFREKLKHADVIMVSHSAETIRDFCTTVAVLENGHLTHFDDVNQGISAYEKMMAG
ncbi:MAG: ABC transporter ATP-binding protein [Rhodobacteraceae bacterium]|nr:ABC transporter ATP-binding protein [Paracoccaceae bacterium]